MQLTAVLCALAMASLSSAWSLTVYTTTAGQSIRSTGTRTTGCNAYTIAHTAVNRAVFNPVTDFYPDPTSFELYSDTGCTNKVYVNNKGDWSFAARTVKAYKIR